MKNIICRFLLIVGLLFFSLIGMAATDANLAIAVSIAPLKYCVEQIGSDKVVVTSLVKANQNPETYEPDPKQILALNKTAIYFSIDMPTERVWLTKIRIINPHMAVVDLRKNIKLRALDGGVDPHIWTSPLIMQQMAKTVCDSLVKMDSQNAGFYQKNYKEFARKLTALDQNINLQLKPLSNRIILVFHPAWGYFADAYKLQQVAIETEGKEAGPQDLAKIFKFVHEHNVKVIFVQPQFSKTQAQAVANMLHAKLVVLDPLAEDYLANLENVANIFVENLK